MKLKSIFFYGLFFILLSPHLLAQEQLTIREKAEKLYQEFQYAKAAPIYLKLTDTSNPKLADMEHLAECYKKMNKYEDAEIWYARIVGDPKSDPKNLFYYGEILKTNARYPEAKEVLEKYMAKTGDKKRALVSIAGCDSADVWISNPTTHVIRNEQAINTDLSEFSVFPIGERTVSFAGEPKTSVERDRYGWTGSPFLRIFLADRLRDNSLKTNGIAKTIINNNGPYHIGPISTNKENNVYFITRTYPGNRGHLSKVDKETYLTQNMELYIQSKVYGQWQKPEPFAYNNVQQYSLGHAVLSVDEKLLYFVSDMPGGRGGKDIWYSEMQADGKWSKCLNAGSSINTPGDEMFPTIAPDGTLYFASNGLPGMGGFDIFYSKGSRYKWDKPINMQYPVNSPADDFSYILNPDLKSGYLSSNRVNGKGGDDIYSFVINAPNNQFLVEAIVYDKKTMELLPEAEVVLYETDNTILAKQKTNAAGLAQFKVERRELIRLKATKNTYYPDTARVWNRDPAATKVRVALYLDRLFEVGKTYRLENIHYNFDKDNIRQDASIILDGLVKVMHENPTLKIELASHTDCRGTESYNEALSQRRAQSAVNYLVSRGIARDRMIAKGYGESRLINKCADGVNCSEEEHQQNRRTEFTVLSY